MKIICVGLNYHDHIEELGFSAPEEPIFFMKPETALLVRNRPFFYLIFLKRFIMKWNYWFVSTNLETYST